jgi:hypothetical protein
MAMSRGRDGPVGAFERAVRREHQFSANPQDLFDGTGTYGRRVHAPQDDLASLGTRYSWSGPDRWV